jgi:peptide/nickel transport system ATP-binding protein
VRRQARRACAARVPYPDPDRPLDFDRIGAGRQSNPAAWPEPFSCANGDPPMQQVSEGHFVRASVPLSSAPKPLAAAIAST